MKPRIWIFVGLFIIIVGILLSGFSIEEKESYIVWCEGGIFSDYKTCKPLWKKIYEQPSIDEIELNVADSPEPKKVCMKQVL